MKGLTTAKLTAALLAGVSTPTIAATADATEPGAGTTSAAAASAGNETPAESAAASDTVVNPFMTALTIVIDSHSQ